MKDCVFCKIVKGVIPSIKEYEDDEVLAFRDINPQAPVHVLIIPKKHIPRLSETEESDFGVLGKCQTAARKVAEKLGISDSFRVLNASGAGAGQSVMHIHYHLLGGWKGSSPNMETEKNKFP